MTDASKKLPISIDYTSRDFYSLRADLIDRIKANIPSWAGTDPADFGIALVEAFSYMGDIANYYIDRVANESYLTTATQRYSILGYANSIGYTVDGYRSATTTLTFGNSSASAVTVPAGTVVYVDKLINNDIRRIKFTTDNAITVPANLDLTTSAYSISATQGYSVATSSTTGAQAVETGVYGVLTATTTGQANQSYTLKDNNIVDDSLGVYIYDGTTYVKWAKVTDLALYGKTDIVYTASLDENNYIKLFFGDGVSGSIPPLSNQIWVSYNLGDGVYGNMAASSIGTSGAFILSAPGYTSETISSITSVITFYNSADSLGGADPESNESVRAGAESVSGTVLRAVTLTDYENLSLAASNVGKVKAYSYNYSSVTLFVAPKRDAITLDGYGFASSDIYPGYTTTNDATTFEMATLLADVATTISDYSQIGVTVTVSPVFYTPISIGYTFSAAAGYATSTLLTAIQNHLMSVFSYSNSNITDTITANAIVKEIILIDGVTTASVTSLYKTSAGSGLGTLNGVPGEMFVLKASSITGSNTGVSTLSALDTSYNGTTATPSPVFASATYAYTYTVSGAPVAGFVLTPTTADSNATITVGGTVVASGSAVSLPPLVVGLNATTIAVTNANGVKTNYNLYITRSS
jgi:hypothetical protein